MVCSFIGRYVRVVLVLLGILCSLGAVGCSGENPSPVVNEISAQKMALIQKAKQEQLNQGYDQPSAGWADSASYRWHGATNLATDTAVATGNLLSRWMYYGFVSGILCLLIFGIYKKATG